MRSPANGPRSWRTSTNPSRKLQKIPLDLEKIKAVITVVKSGDKFKIACQADLKAPVAATPAVDQNNLYVRTDEAVMDFR